MLKQIYKKLKWHHPVLIAVIIAISFLSSTLVFREYSINRIKSNVYVGTANVSGRTYDEAANLIYSQYEQLLNRPITLVYQGEKYEFTPSELGVELDVLRTLEKVYLEGYGDTFFHGTANTFSSLFKDIIIKPVIFLAEDKFKKTLSEKIPEIKDIDKIKMKESKKTTVQAFDMQTIIQENILNLETFPIEIVIEPPEVKSEVVYEETPLKKKAEKTYDIHKIYVQPPFTFTYNDGKKDFSYTAFFTTDWIDFDKTDEKGLYSFIKRENMENYIASSIASEINIEAQNAMLKELPAEGSDYAKIEGIAKNGKKVLVDETIDVFYDALNQGLNKTNIVVEEIAGKIVNQTDKEAGELVLLATGLSNFATSPAGRDFNVRKGLNEKVNNIMIPKDGNYNFNKNLGPVTKSAGWKESLAIFGGGSLIPVPGGGLCQVATNVYRAALKAGLPMVEKYNHSLYVHYYVKYGDGLDATIYPGVKNLTFKNDTPNWILIQAYDDGYDGIVNIYGTPDGRKIELIGPFYPDEEIPEEFRDKITLRSNQIAWIQKIVHQNGDNEEKTLLSTYKYLNKAYRKQYN